MYIVVCSFGHCIVCNSSVYSFWLPLWFLQNFLADHCLFFWSLCCLSLRRFTTSNYAFGVFILFSNSLACQPVFFSCYILHNVLHFSFFTLKQLISGADVCVFTCLATIPVNNPLGWLSHMSHGQSEKELYVNLDKLNTGIWSNKILSWYLLSCFWPYGLLPHKDLLIILFSNLLTMSILYNDYSRKPWLTLSLISRF